jgi:hypothetical protein
MRLKFITLFILIIGFQKYVRSQIIEVTHQSNGTTFQIPIESIDSVKFQ